MAPSFTYFLILGLSLIGPLALSFGRKVAFFRKWRLLFPAMLMPVAFYLVWDGLFTHNGVWSFNSRYITGIFVVNLPLEEVLFFLVVPYCCVFIYECIRCYFPKLESVRWADRVLQFIGALLLIAGLFYFRRAYTSVTFCLTAAFIGALYFFRDFFRDFSATFFLIAYAIALIPFLVVNGLLTALPVVEYNDAENLGIRIYTIPFEDVFYGMLLMMMIIALYERRRYRSLSSAP